jgi:hypothetical protein
VLCCRCAVRGSLSMSGLANLSMVFKAGRRWPTIKCGVLTHFRTEYLINAVALHVDPF